jgi:hypothetical protein
MSPARYYLEEIFLVISKAGKPPARAHIVLSPFEFDRAPALAEQLDHYKSLSLLDGDRINVRPVQHTAWSLLTSKA